MEEFIEIAKKAQENSYSPYSNFKVGAVLITKEGKIYTGCNVENHGIMSICAERVAFTKAISEGERNFTKILVIGDKDYTTPCGYCRQFMSEFVNKEFEIYTVYNGNKTKKYLIEELLPQSFNL